jgi:hypothetical protein
LSQGTKKDLLPHRPFSIYLKTAPSSDIRAQIPSKERFTQFNALVTVCKAHWLVSINSGLADEPISEYRLLWRNSDHRDHGYGSFRKFGKRIGEFSSVIEPGPACRLFS